MPSSTSSSDSGVALMQDGEPGDDPAAAIGPVLRPLPSRNLGTAAVIALILFALALGLWEAHWRQFGATPGYRNSDGAWAAQRRRIDNGEGDATVIIGSSRALFDIQLPVWERITGKRPIQLALEGTAPVFALEDLADDPAFTGRLVVGVTPVLFFANFNRRASVLSYFRNETLSQRASQWLSENSLEQMFAWFDPDFALFNVLERQPWPARDGVRVDMDVRKLMVSGPDRASRMWNKVESDPEYSALARTIWTQVLTRPPPPREISMAVRESQLQRTAVAVAKLRARGVPVVFVRAPSAGLWREVERRGFPREQTWDVLLARSGAPGIHFEDHAELQNLNLPDWSHLAGADADRYTEAVLGIIEREDLWKLP